MTVRETGEIDLLFWSGVLPSGTEYVYVIQGDPGGPIKVGRTRRDVKVRMAEHQTGNPQRLRLLFVIPGDHGLEWNLHKRLWRSRIRGEWFDGPEVPEFLAFITDLSERLRAAHDGGTQPPDWRDFGKWKRAFRDPPPTAGPASLGPMELPPPVPPEEAVARLAAHWTRPARTGGRGAGPHTTGTIN